MLRSVVVRRSRFVGVPAFEIWKLVADPERLAEWTPLRKPRHMGTLVPGPGQLVFAATPLGRPARLTIEEWEAGHRVRVTIETDRPRTIDVVVSDETDVSSVEMRYLSPADKVSRMDRALWGWALGSCLRRISRLV